MAPAGEKDEARENIREGGHDTHTTRRARGTNTCYNRREHNATAPSLNQPRTSSLILGFLAHTSSTRESRFVRFAAAISILACGLSQWWRWHVREQAGPTKRFVPFPTHRHTHQRPLPPHTPPSQHTHTNKNTRLGFRDERLGGLDNLLAVPEQRLLLRLVRRHLGLRQRGAHGLAPLDRLVALLVCVDR